MDKEQETKLPYHADVQLLEKMLADLKTTGIDGINLETLWADVGSPNKNLRSFTLGLGKYLNLIDSDSKRIWLTNLGTTLRYMDKDERNKTLSLKLPDKYLTMFKWIRDEKELRSNELKIKFVETWPNFLTPSVLDRAITTFLNYCDWLQIITYQGRGNQAKAIITDFGKRVLELSLDEIKDNTQSPPKSGGEKIPEPLKLPEGTYPILIKTNDRDFDWDVKSPEDWAVIDSVIASIKKGWESTTGQKISNGGDDK